MTPLFSPYVSATQTPYNGLSDDYLFLAPGFRICFVPRWKLKYIGDSKLTMMQQMSFRSLLWPATKGISDATKKPL